MNPSTSPSRKGPVTLILLGALCLTGPFWGLIGTVRGMIQTFASLAEEGAVAHSEELASGISTSLWTTAAGIAVLPLGFGLLLGGIIWLNRRDAEKPGVVVPPIPRTPL